MLTLTLFSTGILLTSVMSPFTMLWPLMLAQSSSLALLTTTFLLPHHSVSISHSLTFTLGTDSISTPLMILSAWLLPLTLLASRQHLSKQPNIQQRSFMFLLSFLTLTLLVTFASLDLILFYIAFEATLMPTLLLMTRWGHQPERLQAGTYFIFYTLLGSLPLLISLLAISSFTGSTNIPLMSINNLLTFTSHNTFIFWWTASIMAFLAKLPIYGVHLWLPKAHVEAPIAGSMILAAILLKLGGYGLMRMSLLFSSYTYFSPTPLMMFCVWGALMTSIMCLRQTDMKALIAYSSVGHMSLVAASIFSLTLWGINGALMLMIAHGLVSSALFCLANFSYERTSTRTLALSRGLKLLTPLSTIWWLLASAANMALPPLPNFAGEILMITNLILWNPWTVLITGLTAALTAIYSLYLFQSSQYLPNPSTTKKTSQILTMEHLNASLHISPLMILSFKPELICLSWCI